MTKGDEKMTQNAIIVRLGIDSAMYQDDNTVNLGAYATEIGKKLQTQFPDLKFAVSAFEEDNAQTTINFPFQTPERVRDFVWGFVIGLEGNVYSDPDVWEKAK